jgi:hypothetical protein
MSWHHLPKSIITLVPDGAVLELDGEDLEVVALGQESGPRL